MRFRKFNSGSIIFSAIIAIAVISGINTAAKKISDSNGNEKPKAEFKSIEDTNKNFMSRFVGKMRR